ncbi:hypothetical protein [Beijerinckia mobilis]|uniref:hypothetical protein n=1 Tax=Beijerinckia mobilis TaxID=231434 RepID=UPI000551D95E|nr:hypothetical protein [Beijerinckia mobilis]
MPTRFRITEEQDAAGRLRWITDPSPLDFGRGTSSENDGAIISAHTASGRMDAAWSSARLWANSFVKLTLLTARSPLALDKDARRRHDMVLERRLSSKKVEKIKTLNLKGKYNGARGGAK